MQTHNAASLMRRLPGLILALEGANQQVTHDMLNVLLLWALEAILKTLIALPTLLPQLWSQL